MIVIPLTTARHGLSLHVEVLPSADTGLDTTSYIQCELIRSINRNRLVDPLGAVGRDVSNQVGAVIKTLLNH
jgi:mRNA interferase MazF